MEIEKRKIIKYLEKGYDRALIDFAHNLRLERKGADTIKRALIEFSNICSRNCTYCGLRAKHEIPRYRMTVEEIVEAAQKAYENGYMTAVLQSGEDAFYKKDLICEIVKEIKSTCQDMAVTLSVGERSYEEYKAFREVGADRFLLKFETSDKKLYQKMHPEMSFENRIDCLKNLKKLGYETGSGVMIGLPKQTFETIAEDILLFRELKLDMIGTGPFIPHPETPLGKEFEGYPHKDMGRFMELVTALIRVANPDANIPATTALETLTDTGRNRALKSGANVIMDNCTPQEYAAKYIIYPKF